MNRYGGAPASIHSISGAAFFILSFLGTALAQPTFLRTLGDGNNDRAAALTTTPDGGIVVGGRTDSFGAGVEDALIAKWETSGALAWAKTLGGIDRDEITALTTTPAGDIFAAGFTGSFSGGGWNILFTKWESDGTLVWSKMLSGENYDIASALAMTPDGGIAMAGYTNSFGAGSTDAFLAKWSINGTLVWAKTLGGAYDDEARAIATTSDGGIVIAGDTSSFGAFSTDFLLAKWGISGNLEWAKTLGGASEDIAYAITITLDEGIVAAGHSNSFSAGGDDVLMAKWGATGALIWAKMFDGSLDDGAFALSPALDGGFFVAGYTNSFGQGNSDTLLARWWGNGTLAWAKTLGEGSDDGAFALTTLPGGKALTAGYTNSIGTGGSDVLLAQFTAAEGEMIGCSFLQPFSTTTSDITITITSADLNISDIEWKNTTLEDLSSDAVSVIAPTWLETCQGIATTGTATTGLATTGSSTTGSSSQGATTGLTTTGITSPSSLVSPSPSSQNDKSESSTSAASEDQLPLILGLAGAGGALILAGALGTLCFVKRRFNRAQPQASELEMASSKSTHIPTPTPGGAYVAVNTVLAAPSHSAENNYALIDDVNSSQ